MELKFKQSNTIISGRTTPNRVYKLTGYISHYFSTINSLKDIDSRIRYIIDLSKIMYHSYEYCSIIEEFDESECFLMDYIAKKIDILYSYLYNCGDTFVYSFEYNKLPFMVLKKDNSAFILSNEDKVLDTISQTL